MAKQQVLEPTAAQRLATAQDGQRRLRAERAAAEGRKLEAQALLDELTSRQAALQRDRDIRGADVDMALLSVGEQRAAAARQVSAASAESGELAQRIAAVKRELPALEASAQQDELAALVVTGAEAARRYRAALEGFLAAAVVLQSDLAKCSRISANIAERGAQPRTKLSVHLVAGADLDRVLAVARSTGGEPGAVTRATAQLFERWHI
jgi:hypothetical protein